MSIRVIRETPRHQYDIPKETADLLDRIQQGDPVAGWSGDHRMFVRWNTKRQKYEIWRYCEDGVERIISSWKPEEFDSRVLVSLGKGDSWHRDVLGEIEKIESARQIDIDRKLQEFQDELDSRLDFIKRKHISE